MSFGQMPVIKRGVFQEDPGSHSATVLPLFPGAQQGYMDELNRLKIEVDAAKAELRKLTTQIEEARYKAEHPPEPMEQEYASFASEEEIRHMVDAARVEATEILAKAKNEAIEVVQGAQNEGYLNGFNNGIAQLTAEFKTENQPKVDALERLLDRLSDFEEESIRQNEAGLIQLVLGIANKVIGQELATDPKLITSMLRETVDTNRREAFIKISIAPDLLPVEAKASAQIVQLITDTAPNIKVTVDKEAQPGMCVVETPKGYTDLSIDTQLENLKQTLTDE